MTLRGWWRRRKEALTRLPGGMPKLPDQMEDMRFIGASQGAAQEDYNSGAYDEFLFTEEGLGQMPFERMVDDQMSLTRIRLFDQARRAVLRERHRMIDVESDVEQLENKREAVLLRMQEKEEKLDEELQILEGAKTGRAELLWPGTPPQQTSLPNAFLRLMAPYAIFLIVGAVDLGIIFKSFQEIFPRTIEAILFTLPAVGVQIVFPHFIGDRINLLVRRYKHPFVLILEILLLALVWLTFVITLTQIRMNYVVALIADMNDALYFAIYAGFICMILGLGLWLLLVAARHNSHETAYARVNYAIGRLGLKAERLKQRAVAASAAIPALEESLAVAEQGYRDAIESAKVELADVAKSVYRRALVNLTKDVDFTSAYLGVAHPSAKAERAAKSQRRAEKSTKRQSRPEETAEDRRKRRDNFDDSSERDDTP